MDTFSFIGFWGHTARNLLISEDVLAAIQAIKKLGIKIILKIKNVKFTAKLNGYKYRKNIALMQKFRNSETSAWFINYFNLKIKGIGDESLSKRDFKDRRTFK